MPCNHKFKSDLDLHQLDFEPITLIVGTFIPEWPVNNSDKWFYGRTHDANGNRNNHFWDILPRMYGEQSLIDATPNEWARFSHEKKMVFSDLISCIDDADPGNPEHSKVLAGLADKAFVYNFDDFEFVNIVRILQAHKSIKNVYLTRGVTESFWRHLWNPVTQYCKVNHLHERKLLTPSGSSLYQHQAYNNDHPDQVIPLLEDYILTRWKQEWHF